GREVPEDLAACVMRSLEKDPEDRWPTADALRRALEARSATMHKPRRSSGPSPSRGVRAPPLPAQPPSRGRGPGGMGGAGAAGGARGAGGGGGAAGAGVDGGAARLDRVRGRAALAPEGGREAVGELRSRCVKRGREGVSRLTA